MQEEPADEFHLPRAATPSKFMGCMLKLAGVLVVLAMAGAFLLPTLRLGGPSAAHRIHCQINLRQLGLAMQHYHQVFESFPPAFTVDDQGRKLHSWRTLILPYLEEESLYRSIDLSRPWDDPVNAAARRRQIEVYICPSAKLKTFHTTFQVVVGPDTCFPGAQPRSRGDIKDEPGQTLLLVEAPQDRAVHWMEPSDLDAAAFLGITDRSDLSHDGLVNVIFADGSGQPLSTETPAEKRRALLTIAGGEKVKDF